MEKVNLKSDFSIKVMLIFPLSPNQSGMIGFTNSSRINNLFTYFLQLPFTPSNRFQKYERKSQNYGYWCVDFGGQHLHFTHFKRGSESQTLFEDVESS